MPKTKATRRADGRYQRKVYLGTDATGKKKYRYFYGTTPKEVDRQAEELLYSLHKGTDALSGDLPFERWADRYLQVKKPKLAEVYFAGLKGRVAWWCAAVGDIPISKITRSQLQIPLDELAKHNPHKQNRPTSAKTLRDYKQTATAIFRLAMTDRAITYNPAEYIELEPGAPKNTRRALTEEEQGWILQTPHRAQTAAMILLLAGLRRGELLALRVADVDLQAGTIHVDKSVKFVKGRPEIKHGGKTAAATRTVRMPAALTEYLHPVVADRSPFDLLVTDAKGRLMSESAWNKLWKSYMTELNFRHGKFTQDIKSRYDPRITQVIPSITPHMLRHSACTNMILSGVDVLTVKNQMGHASISVTMDIYTHITQEHQESQMSKLDEYLAKRYG